MLISELMLVCSFFTVCSRNATRENPSWALVRNCIGKLLFVTSTIHPGIFHVRALWADSVHVYLADDTIASRHQFKPMEIGENLVVIYYP